ncbi:hypothetical protein J1614_001625 [Plenodomus biglobosus]|nr:hypothetical protein J1614_001625 [Plenodomus biglobosus]
MHKASSYVTGAGQVHSRELVSLSSTPAKLALMSHGATGWPRKLRTKKRTSTCWCDEIESGTRRGQQVGRGAASGIAQAGTTGSAGIEILPHLPLYIVMWSTTCYLQFSNLVHTATNPDSVYRFVGMIDTITSSIRTMNLAGGDIYDLINNNSTTRRRDPSSPRSYQNQTTPSLKI